MKLVEIWFKKYFICIKIIKILKLQVQVTKCIKNKLWNVYIAALEYCLHKTIQLIEPYQWKLLVLSLAK